MWVRRAEVEDAKLVLDLNLFQDDEALGKTLSSDDLHVLLTGRDDDLQTIALLEVDTKQGMAKISRLVTLNDSDRKESIRSGMTQVLKYLKDEVQNIDVVYTTTRAISLSDQTLIMEIGFKILGIFPNIRGKDDLYLNGLAAYYFNGVLEEKRHWLPRIHPALIPFQALALGECGLGHAVSSSGETVDLPLRESEETPSLEAIQAERFVANHFLKIRKKQSQSDSFYPFQLPNTLLTDPEQKVQIFVKIDPTLGFAAIIGENFEVPVDPRKLYVYVLELLKKLGATYIEIISEASDHSGVDCFLRAGFVPTAYFPALKKSGPRRRDFVVLSYSSQSLCRPSQDTPEIYNLFYQEFLRFKKISD